MNYPDFNDYLSTIIKNNEIGILRAVLKNNFNSQSNPNTKETINIKNNNTTFLHLAASVLNSKIMLTLKRYGAIEEKNSEGFTALHLFLYTLIKEGHTDRLKNILSNNKALEKAKSFRDNFENNLLNVAMNFKNKEAINLLKEKDF